LAVLLSIAAIFLVILFESLPLFRSARAELRNASHFHSIARPLLAGYSADGQSQFTLREDNTLEMVFTGARVEETVQFSVSLPHQGEVLSAAQSIKERNSIFLGASNGYVYRLELPQAPFRVGRAAEPLAPAEEFLLDDLARPLRLLKAVKNGAKLSIVSALPSESSGTELKILSVRPGKGLMNSGKLSRTSGALQLKESATALALSADGELLYAGTASGEIMALDLRRAESPRLLTSVDSLGSRGGITALSLLLGDQTLAVGQATGDVDTWMFTGGTPFGGGKLSHKAQVFRAKSGIVSIVPSSRNRSFLSVSQGGELGVHFGTSGATELALQSSVRDATLAGLTNRGEDFFILGESGILENWVLDNPHPEISLGTLFWPVWYEGYASPELVWQSSSGSDEFEPKFSLTPLLF
jgi:phosphate transport system permease protein